ncbi:MAG: hypothetical protein QM536_07075 [Chitinophagaceae bacterium]|nr:hypothetical protein [Chitinophagaceae bacterium]
MKAKHISIFLLVVAVGLSYYLYRSIAGKVELNKEIIKNEAEVIEQLKVIRKAQEAFQESNGRYANTWEELLSFLENGYFYITQRTETVIPKEYGEEEVIVKVDTLGKIAVKDSLFKNNLDIIRNIPYIPNTDKKKFGIWAEVVDKSGVKLALVEVWDTHPINPERKESKKITNQKPLRFGSRTQITTSGNWE